MTFKYSKTALALALAPAALVGSVAQAHTLHLRGAEVAIAGTPLTVTPGRDWNELGGNFGKGTERWTLDGGQLNDVTFFAGIAPGMPLLKERSKKSEPLPKFTKDTLLVEIPELLEGTYRAHKNLAAFQVTSTEPTTFLGNQGVSFSFEFTDSDQLTRKGEARATIIGGKLYMIAFDAPRLSYYDKVAGDYRALADSARMR